MNPGPPEVTADPGRRRLAYAVLLCLAGAGLAVFAATRTWAVELTARPVPLPAVRDVRTGGALLPWVPALAVVGLAGAGALLATRDRLRRSVGGLALLIGVALAAGGGYGLAGPVAGEISRRWPLLCLLGGLLTAVGGGWVAVAGHRWPAMGARYERPARVAAPTARTTGADQREAADARLARDARRITDAWDALDRGEDPTLD